METWYVLSIIDELNGEWYKQPTSYYTQKRINFEYQAYRHSAIREIKTYLKEHKGEDPIKMIEEFRFQVRGFACEAKSERVNFMFSVYCDVANDVLDVLLGMG